MLARGVGRSHRRGSAARGRHARRSSTASSRTKARRERVGAARCCAPFPTLLRVGLAAAVAYRAEFLVWMLSTTMPLVMLALWSAVAREAPVGRFDQRGLRRLLPGHLDRAPDDRRVGGLGDGAGDQRGHARRCASCARSIRSPATAPRPWRRCPCARCSRCRSRSWCSSSPRASTSRTIRRRVHSSSPPSPAPGCSTSRSRRPSARSASIIESSLRVWELWIGRFMLLLGLPRPARRCFPRWLEQIARILPFRLFAGRFPSRC